MSDLKFILGIEISSQVVCIDCFEDALLPVHFVRNLLKGGFFSACPENKSANDFDHTDHVYRVPPNLRCEIPLWLDVLVLSQILLI